MPQGPAEESLVALLTGGFDKPYAFGLTMALASRGLGIDVIGSDDVDDLRMHTTPQVNFRNLWGSNEQAGLVKKILKVLIYYSRLLRYAIASDAKIFHILWNNKFQLFDRTALMLYYKLLGKKVVLTAHNVNAGKRDSNDSLLNRITLRAQYLLADHIFVHTELMKSELLQNFAVEAEAVSVIPFGINNSVPETDLTPQEAKQRLGMGSDERVILFFGAIRPYKGIDYLVEAFRLLAASHPEYKLVIAGEPRKEATQYLNEIQGTIDRSLSQGQVLQKFHFIPDEETEVFFKAADVLVLPYTHVFQSGVLFLGYSFGLPVIGTDVGSIKEEIIEGKTGFLCKPCDAADLSKAIEKYFESDIFQDLENRRREIREYANAKNSWCTVGEMTQTVYARLLKDAI